jgi:hypothetical protein
LKRESHLPWECSRKKNGTSDKGSTFPRPEISTQNINRQIRTPRCCFVSLRGHSAGMLCSNCMWHAYNMAAHAKVNHRFLFKTEEEEMRVYAQTPYAKSNRGGTKSPTPGMSWAMLNLAETPWPIRSNPRFCSSLSRSCIFGAFCRSIHPGLLAMICSSSQLVVNNFTLHIAGGTGKPKLLLYEYESDQKVNIGGL